MMERRTLGKQAAWGEELPRQLANIWLELAAAAASPSLQHCVACPTPLAAAEQHRLPGQALGVDCGRRRLGVRRESACLCGGKLASI